MAQCKCGSFAVNDDPQLKLCDRCWRDATIEDLRRRLRTLYENSVTLKLRSGDIIAVDVEPWKQAMNGV